MVSMESLQMVLCVRFKLMSDATKAMQQLNGLEIVGQPMRVQIASVSSADVGMAGLGELDEEDGEKLSVLLPRYISDVTGRIWDLLSLNLWCIYKELCQAKFNQSHSRELECELVMVCTS